MIINMKTIKWELTPYCNLSCRHCGAKAEKKRRVLSLEENKIIANMLKEQGVTSIRFITKETCMYSEWVKLFEYISSLGIHIILITNGTLLGMIELDKLYDFTIDLVAISLEGITSDSNDYIRGAGTFQKVMKVFENLEFLNKKHGFELPVGIQLNLTDKSISEIDNMLNFFNGLPINLLSIGSVIETGNAKYNNSICLEHDVVVEAAYELIKQYEKIDKKRFLLAWKLFSTYEIVYVNLMFNTDFLPTIPKCSVTDSLYEVMSDGSLCRCNLLEDETVIDDEDLSAGSIYDYRLDTKSIAPEKIEKWLNYKNNGFCLQCIYRKECNLCLLTSQRAKELVVQKNICQKYWGKIRDVKMDFLTGKIRLTFNSHTVVKEYENYTKIINPFMGEKNFYAEERAVIDALKNQQYKIDFFRYERVVEKLLYGDALKILKGGDYKI